jgi:SAM-dependent methyltransferase
MNMTEERKRPTDRASWEQRYIDGELPWDSGKPDLNLSRVLEDHGIRPSGKALEIGCGTGTNSIYLAERGFEVTAMDLSSTAIAKAEAKAAAGCKCRFLVGDFLVNDLQGAPFKLAYDRGCLHVFDDAKERERFASRIADLLDPEGMWHSLIGSTDGPPRNAGPPRRSAMEIISAVEPHFEILELRSTNFDQGPHSQARAWALVARRRIFYPA